MIDPALSNILDGYRKLYGTGAPARFALGVVCVTQGVAADVHQERLLSCLALHQAGDWGVVDDEDKAANERSLRDGSRVLSVWPIDPTQPCAGRGDNTLWIITESAGHTTALLPDEY